MKIKNLLNSLLVILPTILAICLWLFEARNIFTFAIIYIVVTIIILICIKKSEISNEEKDKIDIFLEDHSKLKEQVNELNKNIQFHKEDNTNATLREQIENLSDKELYFFLANIFIYDVQDNPKLFFTFLTGEDKLWDEYLNNKFKQYFDFIKRGEFYHVVLKEGLPYLLLTTIKKSKNLSNAIIHFFKVLFFENLHNSQLTSLGLPGTAQSFLLNLNLLPDKAKQIISDLIKEAETTNYYRKHANILDNMGNAIIQNLETIDKPTYSYLEKLLEVKNRELYSSLRRHALRNFINLPVSLQEKLFSEIEVIESDKREANERYAKYDILDDKGDRFI